MSQRFFITGTDTNVGKTVLSALLCAALNARYWKPIQTGAREGTDRRQVMEWAGLKDGDALPEVYLFDDPVSPHLAALRAGKEISLARITLPDIPSSAPLIVEGAGGILAPINISEFMTGLMQRLALPVVLAARSTLGTINHTLLSLQGLRAAGLTVHGVVIIGPRDVDNELAIEQYGRTRVIGRIPPLSRIDRDTLREVFTDSFSREAFT
ncbi:MAG TPA: dethiobiotin synthase [Candidatus Angelobacter sp.]|nr:dethiobiotin synthase [Candidatus Angelobacter sp.]